MSLVSGQSGIWTERIYVLHCSVTERQTQEASRIGSWDLLLIVNKEWEWVFCQALTECLLLSLPEIISLHLPNKPQYHTDRQLQRIWTQDLKEPESFSCDSSNASQIAGFLAFSPPVMIYRWYQILFSVMCSYDLTILKDVLGRKEVVIPWSMFSLDILVPVQPWHRWREDAVNSVTEEHLFGTQCSKCVSRGCWEKTCKPTLCPSVGTLSFCSKGGRVTLQLLWCILIRTQVSER